MICFLSYGPYDMGHSDDSPDEYIHVVGNFSFLVILSGISLYLWNIKAFIPKGVFDKSQCFVQSLPESLTSNQAVFYKDVDSMYYLFHFWEIIENSVNKNIFILILKKKLIL